MTITGWYLPLILMLVTAACSHSGSSYLPSGRSSSAVVKNVPVSFDILIPRYVAHNTSRRQPQYVSPSTQSLSIALNSQPPVISNLAPGLPGCALVSGGTQCTVGFLAPPGSDTFSVSTFDGANASGHALSTASVTQTILAAQTNTVDITLDGIVAKIILALQATPPPEGTPASAPIGISVMAQDADGNTIVGPGAYDNAITLTDTDPSKTTTLSTSSVTTPSSTVTLSYDGGAVSSAGLNARIAGSSPGVAQNQVTNVYFVTAQDEWITWGKSPYRNSYNPNETTLSPSNVGSLKQLWSAQLGGIITDEPIIVANVRGTSEGPVDVLYIGDAHASFFAINAGTGNVLWSKTFQKETINGSSTDPAQMGCFDQPGGVYGIGETAVADTTADIVYVVDALGDLYGLDLATGTTEVGPVQMWPYRASDGLNITNDYGALNEDAQNGVVYVPSGAHCGNENFGGVQQYNISGHTVAHFFSEGGPVTQPNLYGGVWGPGGVSIDPRQATNHSFDTVYLATGDGAMGSGKFPCSVVRLNESIGVNSAAVDPLGTGCLPDSDFGDTPLVFVPAANSGCASGTMLDIAENKNGTLYVFNADNLAGGQMQAIQLGTSSEGGINLGTAAYDPTRNLVYIQNGSDSSDTSTGIRHGLVAFTISGCQLQFAWQATVGPNLARDGPPAPPTVANGVVYYADGPGTGCSTISNPNCRPVVADLYAFNATTGAQLFHTTLPGPLLTPPVVVNGRVYVTSWSGFGPGMVFCFGL